MPRPIIGNLLAVSLRASRRLAQQSASSSPGPLRAAGPTNLALPLGELSLKVTERVCKRSGDSLPTAIRSNLLAVSLRDSRRLAQQSASSSPGPLRAAGPTDLALPLGELSPKVTERVCRAGPMCPARLSAISLPCHCEPTAGWRGNPHPPPQPAEGSVPYRALR